MKTILKIIFILIISFSYFTDITYADGDNLTTGEDMGVSSVVDENGYLQGLENPNTDLGVDIGGQKGIYNSIIRVARDLKNLFFLIAGLYFTVLVLILLFGDKTEESASNFKKGIIWISIGIVVTQISYYLINVLFDKDVTVDLSARFIDTIVQPIISMMETAASFLFLAIMIYAFYTMVTSNGDEEKAKTGKMSVLYAAIGFIVVKISKTLVTSIYGKTSCTSIYQNNCTNNTNVEGFAAIVVTIINWMNGFVGIIVILMIIYAGFTVLTSAGDEEKLKNAKLSILYIAIGLTILFMNYLILTFFILDPVTGNSPII